jgi:hypothetical protein
MVQKECSEIFRSCARTGNPAVKDIARDQATTFRFMEAQYVVKHGERERLQRQALATTGAER